MLSVIFISASRLSFQVFVQRKVANIKHEFMELKCPKSADKELLKVRGKFVEKVSKEVIKQLLDDLLEDSFMNDGEKDSVLEENSSRADQARCLIDLVRKKGDEASRKMIAQLQCRDPSLHKTLGLSSGQPAQLVAEPQTVQDWSPTLIPTTEAFWREKQNDKSIYPVTKNSIMSRVALLITNIKFTDEKLNRNGAEKDEQNMEKQLKALRYEVVKHTNLTGKEIDDAVIKFSKHPKLKETDSVFVIIMSHGKLGAVLGVNHKDEEPDEFPIDNICKYLDTQKCRALLDKPKIIIIQACRGGKDGAVLVSDSAQAAVVCDDVQQPDLSLSAGVEDIEEDALQHAHKEKDFIRFLSCTPDTVSYRNRDHGSFLIKFIFEVVNTFAHKEDIEELFRKVMQRFEEDFPSATKKQMPTKDRCTLPKRFYLFPGL
ncbi:caspase a-like isoform X1 [Thunnus albacares]|uniref:caspase a-like isoform X1 n=1 Tax=Thunnus albacares TaxID=8236 RepID=UPI001CF6E538|nr:caspase a-like isoform X1 [Thunnus albacares]